jgi:hypothetical protein
VNGQGRRIRIARALRAFGLVWTFSAAPVFASEVSDPAPPAPGSAEPWIERMLDALRLGDTLAARIHARTVDHAQSEREVVIEVLRDARGPTMRTLVEVRDPEDASIRPAFFRIDSFPDGSVVSWVWDIRWHQFVRSAGLDGTENFDGTHFRLEDLGFTGLAPRRSGSARELPEQGVVELQSEAYHHYDRVETRLDAATGLPQRTLIYDGTGARIWEIEFDAVETIGGHAVPTRMQARNPMTLEHSTLEWVQVAVGLPVPADVFDLERLDAVIRHGGDPIEFPESPSLPAAPRTEADAATALVPRR